MPTLITAERPISSGRLQSTMVVMMAPLCEMKAIFPGLGETGSKVVLIPWWGSMSPRQFGPMIRIPYWRAVARTCSSICRPATPASRNPDEMMITSGIFFSPASFTICGTPLAGIATTAISTEPGTAASDGYAVRPRISGAFGLTG